jgi:hypothetical protein
MNFPNGLASAGIPLHGVGIPPIRGTYYHVFPGTGGNGNSGKTKEKAVADIQTAYGLCTTNKGDGIILWGTAESTAKNTSYLTAALDWTKNDITVVGINSGNGIYQRSRVSNKSTALTLAYLVDVQGSNNAFYNVFFGNFGTDAAAIGGVKVSGSRNSFFNCNVIGAGHATPAAVETANSLTVSGQENLFVNSTFGTDTIEAAMGTTVRGVVNFAGGGERNVFKGCRIIFAVTSGTTCGLVKWVGSGDAITRSVVFDSCIFEAYKLGTITGALANAFVGTAPNNGSALLFNCACYGVTAWDAVTGNDRVYCAMPATTAAGAIGLPTT